MVKFRVDGKTMRNPAGSLIYINHLVCIIHAYNMHTRRVYILYASYMHSLQIQMKHFQLGYDIDAVSKVLVIRIAIRYLRPPENRFMIYIS